jgi:hypothetical protein
MQKTCKVKKNVSVETYSIKKKRLPTGDINLLSTNELLKVAQNAFNAKVRERDKNKGCICGCRRKVEQAGHFFPAGSYSGVRFDERNVHGISQKSAIISNRLPQLTQNLK